MRFLREHAPSVLLGVLVVMFVAYPIADRMGSEIVRFVLDGLFALVMLAALLAGEGRIAWRRRAFWAVLGVIVLRVAGTALRPVLGPDEIRAVVIATACLTAAVIFYLGFALLRRLTRNARVTVDTIAGACAVYVLLAVGFADLHMATYLLDPGDDAFAGLGGRPRSELLVHEHPRRDLVSTFTYYSVVTQTTLGYGDITPRTPLARGLAMAQTILGQLYLAILLARLVAMELSQRGSGARP